MYLNHDLHFAFVHIPKTGGTSVLRAIAGDSERADHSIEGLDEAEDFLRACFVRHPVARFISAFRYSSDLALRGGNYLSVRHPVRTLIVEERLESVNNFVSRIESLGPDWLFKNLHFRPQAHWITRANPHFIGRSETLEQDFLILCSQLGIEAPKLGKHRVSKQKLKEPLGEAESNLVCEWYRDDFELLNY